MSPLESYEINIQFVLGIQNLGVGGSCANTLLGVLGVSHKAFYRYSDLEESIAAEQITLGEDILEQNLQDELGQTIYCTQNNYWCASLSIDCGWLKRASGRKYDSGEGHSIFVGNKTRKVVAAHCMSKICRKCKLGIPHPKELCPKNFEGTSKAMEGHGAVVNAKWLYARRVIIHELVMDDDSPTQKLLSPMVSRTLKTGRVETKGAMPPNYPPPTVFCDCNHRTRCWERPSFALAHGIAIRFNLDSRGRNQI
jgi:hypothetical protein